MPRVRILPGLPACAPAAKHFGSTGPQHRDGLLVELVPDDAPSWVGSFQRGATCFDEAVFEPGTQQAVVIAGGLGYVVDPSTRACDRTFGGHIEQVWTPSPGTLVFSNGLWMETLGPSGLLWHDWD